MEISVEEKLKKEISDRANELMADWPSSRNRQKQFVLEYVATGFTNASEAARNAGYSKNTARSLASNMLAGVNKYKHIPPVVEELKKAYQERQSELKIADGTEVLQLLSKFGRQEPTKKYYKSEKLVDGKKTIEENTYITTPADEDAIRALDLLGKSYALFTERQQIDANINTDPLEDLINHYKGDD